MVLVDHGWEVDRTGRERGHVRLQIKCRATRGRITTARRSKTGRSYRGSAYAPPPERQRSALVQTMNPAAAAANEPAVLYPRQVCRLSPPVTYSDRQHLSVYRSRPVVHVGRQSANAPRPTNPAAWREAGLAPRYRLLRSSMMVRRSTALLKRWTMRVPGTIAVGLVR